MNQAACETASVLLIDASIIRARKVVEAIARDRRLTLLALCKSFEDAYNLAEAERPSIIAIAAELLANPGFPMFKALLDGLETTATILCPPGADSSRFTRMGRVLDLCEYPKADDLVNALRLLTCDPASGHRGTLARAPKIRQRLVVIGASTGGVEALSTVLSHYPVDCPPTLVVQHIGHDFVPGFARRLNQLSSADVTEAMDGAPIEPGRVYIAPGMPAHLTIATRGWTCRLDPGPPISGHRPSVNALFDSAVRFGTSVVAVLLTGMGRDGAEGMLKIRQSGGHTIGQDKRTCVVYGMPRVAHDLGGVAEQLPIERIGPAILAASADHLEKGRAK
ncbi:MAG: chemotaxis protein CheB [Rhodobacteraceae bacterium]|nr:chemotaxis protein CheB [Paracoccaceae bacterium]MAY44770.1 chemotaxis protein CheB [Paracoccaceae bacterium]